MRVIFKRRNLLFSEGYYNQAIFPNVACENCYDWELSNVEYIAHPEYPIEMNPNNIQQTLQAKKITFDSMKNACYIMFEKIYLHQWKKKYLSDMHR